MSNAGKTSILRDVPQPDLTEDKINVGDRVLYSGLSKVRVWTVIKRSKRSITIKIDETKARLYNYKQGVLISSLGLTLVKDV